MDVGRTQIQTIMKQKREIMDEYEGNANAESKRHWRSTAYDEINELCLDWFNEATGRRVNVSGPLLKEKASDHASDLGI